MKKTTVLLLIILTSICFAEDKNIGTTSNGRYQLIQLSSMRRDQYLLDTKSGKVWNKACLIGGATSDQCEYSAFLEVDVEGLTGSLGDIFKKANEFKKASTPQEQK